MPLTTRPPYPPLRALGITAPGAAARPSSSSSTSSSAIRPLAALRPATPITQQRIAIAADSTPAAAAAIKAEAARRIAAEKAAAAEATRLARAETARIAAEQKDARAEAARVATAERTRIAAEQKAARDEATRIAKAERDRIAAEEKQAKADAAQHAAQERERIAAEEKAAQEEAARAAEAPPPALAIPQFTVPYIAVPVSTTSTAGKTTTTTNSKPPTTIAEALMRQPFPFSTVPRSRFTNVIGQLPPPDWSQVRSPNPWSDTARPTAEQIRNAAALAQLLELAGYQRTGQKWGSVREPDEGLFNPATSWWPTNNSYTGPPIASGITFEVWRKP
jgi:hypothetical protein